MDQKVARKQAWLFPAGIHPAPAKKQNMSTLLLYSLCQTRLSATIPMFSELPTGTALGRYSFHLMLLWK